MGDYSVADKILRRMRASRGAVFSATDFLDIGSRAAIDQAFTRIVRAGKARRIGRGLYDIPRKGLIVNSRSPSIHSIAAAVARKSGARIVPSGAVAANEMGLSTQVPAQARYLTDRTTRIVRVGNQTIRFDHVGPRRLVGDSVSQAVIEALRHIGKSQITSADIDQIRKSLSQADRKALRGHIRTASSWMRPFLIDIADGPAVTKDRKRKTSSNGASKPPKN